MIYLFYLESNGAGAFGHSDIKTTLFIIFAGAATVMPLFFFTHAAKRVPLSQLGLLQYMAPILQFLIGVFIYKEIFTTSTLIGFIFIWSALGIYSWNLLQNVPGRKK